MTSTRTQIIVERILRRLSDLGQHNTNSDTILSELDAVQQDLCQDCLAFPDYRELVLQKGADTYDLGKKIYMPQTFIEPTTWTTRLELVASPDVWGERVRLNKQSIQPLYVMVRDRYLYFSPAPTISGEVLKMYLYLLPQRDLSLDKDPELSLIWDDALEYGALAKITGKPDWAKKYEDESTRKAGQQTKEIIGAVHQKESYITQLGF